MGLFHKVLIYVEYRAVAGVGTHSPGGGGVGGVNILEDVRHRIGLLQYNLSTVSSHTRSSPVYFLRRTSSPVRF